MSRDRPKLLVAETLPSLLVLAAGILALFGVAVLWVLPESVLSSIAVDAAGLFGDGTVSNPDDVIASLLRTLPLAAAVAVAAVAIGALGLFLRSLNGRGAGPEVPGSPAEPLTRDAWRASLHVLVFSLLAFPCLGQGFSGDEAWTLKYVHGSWLEIFAPSAANNHILSTILIKLAVSVFGESELIVRLPAYLAGCVTVVIFYRLARACWQSPLIAHLATFQLSTCFGAVFCGTNARGYAVAMACTVGFALLRRRSARGVGRKDYVSFLLLTVAATLTLPTAGLIAGCFLASVVIPAVARKAGAREALRFLNAFIAAGVVSFSVYAWSLPVRAMYMASRGGAALDEAPDRALYFFSFWAGPAGVRSGGALVALLVAGGLISLAVRRSPLAVFSFLAIAGALAVHLRGGYPSFWYSALGLVLVPFALGEVWFRCARGAAPKVRVAAVVLAAVALAALAAVTSSRMWSVKTYSGELAELAAALQREEGARVALVDPGNNTTYYFQRTGVEPDVFGRFEEITALPDSDYDLIVETPPDAGRSLVQPPEAAGATEIPAALRRGRRVCRFDGWIDSYVVLYRARWDDRFRCTQERRRS